MTLPQPQGTIDRERFDATTEEDIARQMIEDGESEGDFDESQAVYHRGAAYYRELRERLGGLSHAEFARRFGVDEQTAIDWERGFRAPDGPAEVLLQILEREPEVVARALAARVA
jgi:putative transcriptional regulator